ncbi:TPA: phage portal protein [Staphylococcus aureus]
MTLYKLIDDIEAQGILPKHIEALIESHKDDRERMVNLYNRYKTHIDYVPIFKRRPIEEKEDFETGGNVRRLDVSVNNKLNNSFDSEIVDTRVGYLHGVPVTYDLDENAEKNEKLKKFITNFAIRNSVDDEDSEIGKMAAICGYGARLAYIDTNGDIRIKNIDPYNVIFVGDNILEPTYSLRYFYEKDDDNGTDYVYAEFYDNTYYYVFRGEGIDALQEVGRYEHLFDYNPLFGVPNNKEMIGDAEKVIHLIDAYDLTMSDASSEISQTRLAYLVLRGMGMSEEMIQETQKSGAFELFDKDMDVKYLTKDVNDTMIENHLDRIEKNIMRFAKSLNFNSDEFNGNVPIIGMKLKLMALENKCMTFERKMTAMLRYQFKVILSALKRKGYNLDDDSYLNLIFKFTRNIPVNKLEESQVLINLKGQVSERTRLGQSQLVDDVDYELDEMEKESLEFNDKLPDIDEGDANDKSQNNQSE